MRIAGVLLVFVSILARKLGGGLVIGFGISFVIGFELTINGRCAGAF